jgi:hypothetical protein
LLELMSGQLGEHHCGELRRETAEAKAERIVSEQLQQLGWKESELRQRGKSDPAKLALAARLRRETTLPIKRIAARLQSGTSKSSQQQPASLDARRETIGRKRTGPYHGLTPPPGVAPQTKD